MTGFTHALGSQGTLLYVAAPVALGLLLVSAAGPLSLLTGCAIQRGYRQDSRQLIAEADAEEAAITGASAAEALLQISRIRDARGAAADLQPWTGHPDPRVRTQALHSLALVGDPGFALTMSEALSDDDRAVRSMAAFALSQHWAWAQEALARRTLSVEIEIWLVEALDERGDLPAVGAKVGALDDLPFIRAVVRALGEFGGSDGEAMLWAGTRIPSLRSPSLLALSVRAKGGRLEPLSAEQLLALQAGLQDRSSDWAVAYLVARAGIGEDAAAGAAAEGLLDAMLDGGAGGFGQGDDLRAWAIRALGRLPADRAVPRLEAALRPESPFRVRLNAVRAASMLELVGVPLLVGALADRDLRVQVEAATLLGTRPTDASLLALRALGPETSGTDGPCGGPLEPARLAGLAGFPSQWSVEDPRSEQLLAQARSALSCGESEVRSAGAGLLASIPGQVAARDLEAAARKEVERTALLALAQGVAMRSDPILEGLLLEWLEGPDPVLGAIAAEGLKGREGAHLDERLFQAAAVHPGPSEWERRMAIIEALAARGSLTEQRVAILAEDPSLHVRRALFEARLASVGRLRAGPQPSGAWVSDLPDAGWGVLDVEGAIVHTSRGVLRLSLYPGAAPATVAAWVGLAEQGFFDGLSFHRVVSDFVVQGGDPEGTGWGGPGFTLRDEFNPIPYRRGTVGMARSGLDTAGSQWFIAHSPQPHLDGHYTVFGQVEQGMDVVDQLRVGDTISSIEIRRRTP